MKSKGLLFILLMGIQTLAADPWGKDADLACVNNTSDKKRPHCQTALVGPLAEILIRFHQVVVSPADGPRSHYFPCSSQYTLNAIRKYGFFYGFLLGCDRLMRENDDPWVYPTILDGEGYEIKYDPVR